MRDRPFKSAIAAERLKLRSVRSTYWLLASLLPLFVLATLVGHAMVAAWDGAPPADRAHYESADMSVVVAPITQLVLAILAALAITSEYRTGAIATTLTAVPNRLRLFGAKVTVVLGLTGAAAVLSTALSTLLSLWLAGDRPPPIEPWTSTTDALGSAALTVATIVVAALVGVGLGAAFRSSAGALAAVAGLLFVGPTIAVYLPDPWDERVSGVLLPSLAHTPEAAVALVLYPVLALGAGAWMMTRRDA
ncbi:ABC transporter permease [Cryptosporangium phraense]|uniref:ABC transporter permease n=1 Tax=Cryptosporangium phraense TaxID=2593070 RepID=A0A545AMJ5_9ACTN|nr:ABC transporter permease [Cryptosporangium phraense]TQS42532.1 ABC transporter permease [Cryptosporangium phraense]